MLCICIAFEIYRDFSNFIVQQHIKVSLSDNYVSAAIFKNANIFNKNYFCLILLFKSRIYIQRYLKTFFCPYSSGFILNIWTLFSVLSDLVCYVQILF
jgi:hypothetical protein